jgi:bacteriophage holin
MEKINWKNKLTSRKWWTSITSFVTLMIIACGGTESIATQVSAIIMAGAVVIGYTIGEGLIDSARSNKQEDK